jgi:hypothetical protein
MSKWLKQFLFGIWGLLLIPLITPILDKWLEENIFDSKDMAAMVFSNPMASTVFNTSSPWATSVGLDLRSSF